MFVSGWEQDLRLLRPRVATFPLASLQAMPADPLLAVQTVAFVPFLPGPNHHRGRAGEKAPTSNSGLLHRSRRKGLFDQARRYSREGRAAVVQSTEAKAVSAVAARRSICSQIELIECAVRRRAWNALGLSVADGNMGIAAAMSDPSAKSIPNRAWAALQMDVLAAKTDITVLRGVGYKAHA